MGLWRIQPINNHVSERVIFFLPKSKKKKNDAIFTQERKDARRAFPNLAPIASKAAAPTIASTLAPAEEKTSTFEVGDAQAGSSMSAEERRRAKVRLADIFERT